MLIVVLIGLGWLAAAAIVAKLVGRVIANGARRERSLADSPAERIAWIRGEEQHTADEPDVRRGPADDHTSGAQWPTLDHARSARNRLELRWNDRTRWGGATAIPGLRTD